MAIAALVMLLCAPFLSPPQKDHKPKLQAPVTEEEPPRIGVKFRRGDTLSSVLGRFGIEPPSAYAIVEKVRPFLNPRKIQPGHDVQMVLSPEDRTVQGVELVVDNSVVRVKATAEGGWLAEREEIPFVRETRLIQGTINDSLYQSGVGAGLTPGHILALAKMFEYDIDFFSDFRQGDGFHFAVEESRYADGRRILGRILAAELESGDETFSAFYYVSKDGGGAYYDSDGRAVRRSFLRAPLSYVRISSPFSLRRRHPIFRTVRPHLAIDYAAPAGTTVVAIGRGRVVFAGWRKGYGKVVDIRHSGGYTSRYAHFSRFAAGMKRGKTVDAGDVVGYVGQTGHATGPHLHFEFLRNGQKINFLSLRLPRNQRLAGEDLQRFQRLRSERQVLLRSGDNQVVRSTTPQGF
ncbi:MAG TPA: peptidoglycan DD-metalloendopeptidase family protein [Candidatus Binatia bacterium]|nr:peptidoglycan DD-metalloendopeptidase family protein [Candidatus Binatia bacterium]